MSWIVSRRLLMDRRRWSKSIPGRGNMNKTGKGESYLRDNTIL